MTRAAEATKRRSEPRQPADALAATGKAESASVSSETIADVLASHRRESAGAALFSFTPATREAVFRMNRPYARPAQLSYAGPDDEGDDDGV